jgi:predicted TIM-barrel fold metal-dependent hydrolase
VSRFVIDCDVHHNRVTDADVIEYLPKEWRDFVDLPGPGRLPLRARGGARTLDHPDGTYKRLDTFPENGGEPGSDYELMRTQLLDACDIDVAHLSFDDWIEPTLPQAGLATALCRAMNDWSADHWLAGTGDDRLCSTVIVPMHDPREAAAEIRRMGQNPRIISAFIAYNPLALPLGNPVYEPVYEAAAEMDLPIYLHVNAGEFLGAAAPLVGGGGAVNYRFEGFLFSYQPTALHIASMIMHGVFERHPKLKLLISECGLFWVPWLATTLDDRYDLMRRESRWVRKRPSEYMRERTRYATQPIEATPADREEMVDYLKVVDGIEEMLCFSTDYPHWDSDMPSYIRSILPKSWHDKVFRENGLDVFRLPSRGADRVPAAATAG